METTEKIHWRKVFNSDYLGSCDLEDGKYLKAVIKSVTIQNIKGQDGKAQDRNVATFVDPTIKPMILNATNCRIIKKFAKSSFIDDWKNIPIQIYVAQFRAFGEDTEGLRIRETQPKLDKPQLTPSMKAWAKAIDFLKKEGNSISGILVNYDMTDENRELLISQAL